MGNHFQAIGFAIDDDEQFQRAMVRGAKRGRVVRVRNGAYHHWSPGGGAEVWVQSQGRDVLGGHPHFDGGARMRVAVTARVRRSDTTPLDGALHAWAAPLDENDPESGMYPFVFVVPDYRTLDGLELPAVVDVHLVAFASDIEAHASEQAYVDSQETEFKYAPKSFVPVGLFAEDGESAEPLAILAGTVLAAELRTNPEGRDFLWICARTLGGEIDIVADPEHLAVAPVPGGIVSGFFYLSGRIVEVPVPDRAPGWRGVFRRKHR